jgi:hypothetical protein
LYRVSKNKVGMTMKANEVRTMSVDQLQDELLKLKRAQLNVSFPDGNGSG